MTQQWWTKSQVVLLTNCFGFPSAPWVNYVSFKYFVPAEYSPLSGVYCVEIQHPPQSSFPLHSLHMCVRLSLPLGKTSEKEKSGPTSTCPIPKIPHLITDLHHRK